MSFAGWEFPHTNNYDSDLRELIRMYKQLSEDYVSIKTQIDKCVEDYGTVILENNQIKQRMDSIESKMSGIETQVNNRLNQFSKEINQSVDSKISELNKSIASLISNVNGEITELTNYVTNQVTSIRKEVASNYSKNRNYTDSKLSSLEQYMLSEDKRIESLIDNIKVDQSELVSPIDGVQKTSQEVVNDLYYNLRNWVLRAMDYDNLKLTVDEYDSLNVSAWNYDNLSKWYVREKPEILEQATLLLSGIDDKISAVSKEFNRRIIGYSPFSGLVKNVVDLFSEMSGYLRQNGAESAEYDSLELTADEYDSKELTAYIYDWYARLVLISGVSEITAQTYDNLLLNAYQYDAFRLRAIDYDMYAGTLLLGA